MSFDVALSETVELKVAGVIDVDGVATQSFSAGDAAWGFQIFIDGVEVWNGGGTRVQDVVPLTAIKFCNAGSRLVQLRWAAATSVTLTSAALKIRGFNKTSG